jgi:hypothetical protein
MPDNDDFGPDTRGDTIISTIPSKILEESRLHDGFLVKQSNIVQSATPMKPSQTQVNVWAHIPIFPEFLLPGTFDEHLRKFKRIVAESIPAQKFMPLMPPHISRRLIENSFGDIMSEYQLLDLSNFVELLDAQYAASSLGPAGNPARWTVVNAIVALAVRAKTAPGSENALSGITHGFYQNATRVLPELILQDPCLLSIQTLLAMAMFARCIPDVRAFIMLATNASRQLELLTLNLLSTAPAIGMKVAKQYEEVYRTSNVFDKNISEFLNTEAALQQGQAQLTQPESQSEGQADAVSLYSI